MRNKYITIKEVNKGESYIMKGQWLEVKEISLLGFKENVASIK